MAATALVMELPLCDYIEVDAHHPPNVKAVYDAKTKAGPWANMCARCYRDHGVREALQTGVGQRLVVMPRIGQGATIRVGTDCYAAVVVDVSGSGKTVTVRHAEASEPGAEVGGYGWERFATDDDLSAAMRGTGADQVFTLRDRVGIYVKKGEPLDGGRRVKFGTAREYRDPSF